MAARRQLAKSDDFFAVLRTIGERTTGAVLDVLQDDNSVGDVKVISAASALDAAIATYSAFAEHAHRYKYMLRVDADLLLFPGFGAWFKQRMEQYPFPVYSRWFAPLLDWVVQGKRRTVGGIVASVGHEAERTLRAIERSRVQVEPEHEDYMNALNAGCDYRPSKVQRGAIVSVHQYGQYWREYFYRGAIHCLRRKHLVELATRKLAKHSREHQMFLCGYEWNLRTGTVTTEAAFHKERREFREAFELALARLNLQEREAGIAFKDLFSEFLQDDCPAGIYPIEDN